MRTHVAVRETSQMPLTYTRDDARRRITVKVTEPVTDAELTNIVERQAAEGTWSYALLCDVRLLHTLPGKETSRLALERAAAITQREGPRGPVAIVTSSAPLVGVSEAHALRSQRAGRLVQVFWSMDEAQEWLDARKSEE